MVPYDNIDRAGYNDTVRTGYQHKKKEPSYLKDRRNRPEPVRPRKSSHTISNYTHSNIVLYTGYKNGSTVFFFFFFLFLRSARKFKWATKN